MSEDDVLFGYRLRVLDYAARTSVSEACRVFGIHRSTYYVWKRRVERHGLEILRPRERRRPRMPQQLSPFVEERIVAFALGHPGYGPRRIASELGRGAGAGSSSAITASGAACAATGSIPARSGCRWSLATRRRISRRGSRQPERHVEADRPGELVGIDCFFVGRLTGTKGAVWQLTAIDVASSFAWAELVSCPQRQPDRRPDLEARAPGRRRPAGRRLAAGARPHR